MPSTTVFEIIAIVSFAISGAFLLSAVIVFFRLNLLHSIGYLTGQTAAKKIKKIQSDSMIKEDSDSFEKEKIKTDKLSHKNTERTHRSSKKNKNTLSSDIHVNRPADNKTTVLDENNGENQTTVLNSDHSADQTAVLDGNIKENVTTILHENTNHTDILQSGRETLSFEKTDGEITKSFSHKNGGKGHLEGSGMPSGFELETDIVFTHTNETIP